MSKSFRIVPTIYFILMAFVWIGDSYIALGILNYPAIIVSVLLLVQVFHNQKYIGLCYGALIALFSIFKAGESILVYKQTLHPTDGSIRFLIIKLILFGLSLLCALFYFTYFFRQTGKENTTTKSVEKL